ncbi:MAG: OmpA family protein [Planctomycetota bacterium]
MISPDTAHPIRPRRTGALLVLGALVAPGLVSCVSETQMRVAVEERDREIVQLRAQKVELQERVDLLAYEKEDLRAQLDAAQTAMPITQPASYANEVPLVPFPELEEQGISVTQRAGDTVISVPAEITFGSGKATLSENGKGALMAVAARLKNDFSSDSKFYIEGHTDSDPIRKSNFDSNRDLSIQRAMAVLEYLVTEARIPDRRFVVAGYGQYSPIEGASKAQNRRVEIVVKSRT